VRDYLTGVRRDCRAPLSGEKAFVRERGRVCEWVARARVCGGGRAPAALPLKTSLAKKKFRTPSVQRVARGCGGGGRSPPAAPPLRRSVGDRAQATVVTTKTSLRMVSICWPSMAIKWRRRSSKFCTTAMRFSVVTFSIVFQFMRSTTLDSMCMIESYMLDLVLQAQH